MTEDFVIQFRTEGGEIVSQQMSQIEGDMQEVAKYAEQLAKGMVQSVTQTNAVADAVSNLEKAASDVETKFERVYRAASHLPQPLREMVQGTLDAAKATDDMAGVWDILKTQIDDTLASSRDMGRDTSHNLEAIGRLATDAAHSFFVMGDNLVSIYHSADDVVNATQDVGRVAEEVAGSWRATTVAVQETVAPIQEISREAGGARTFFDRILDAVGRLPEPLADAATQVLLIKQNAHEMAQGWADAREKARQTREATEDVGHAADATTMSVKNIAMAFGMVFTAAKAIRFVTDAVLSQERAEVALHASLVNTGLAADRVSASLGDYAKELQNLTEYSDQQILSGVAMMQGMAQLSEEQIPKAMKAAIGLAAVTGRDLNQAFMMLGRAAQGNTSMLSRWGIVIDQSKSKAEQFNELLEIGTDRFSMAEMQADSASGSLAQLGNAFRELSESVAGLLVPLVKLVTSVLKPMLDLLSKLPSWLWTTIAAMTAFLAVVYKVGASGITMAGVLNTMAAGFTKITATALAATGAVKTFMASIGPAGWALMGIGAAISAFGIYSAATASKIDDVTEATKSMNDEIKEAQNQVSVEAEKFNILSNRLLELRSSTSLTRQEKLELQNVIRTMNAEYGDLLQNIDLETTSYERLRNTLQGVSENLLKKQIAEVYGEKYQAQMRKAAKLQVRLNELVETARQKQHQFAEERRMLEGGPGDYNKLSSEAFHYQQIANTRVELEKAKEDLEKFAVAYQQAMDDITNIVFTPSGGGGKAEGGKAKAFGSMPSQPSQYQSLHTELMKIGKTETQLIEEEYAKRKEIITKYATDVAEQETLLANLGIWRAEQITAADARARDAETRRMQEIAGFYEAVNDKGNEYYSILMQIRKAEIASMNITEEQKRILQDYYDQQIKLERLTSIRGDGLLDELRRYGMNAEELERDNHAKELERLEKSIADQRALILKGHTDGLIDEAEYQKSLAELNEVGAAAIEAIIQKHYDRLDEIANRSRTVMVDPFDEFRDKYQLVESAIEGLVYNVTQGFGRMITEGERFSVAMKDAFKNFVNSAISDIGRLLARTAAIWAIQSLFGKPVSIGTAAMWALTGGGAPAIPSGGTHSVGSRPPSSHTLAPPGAGSGYRELIREVQALRRDVYAAQPDSIKMNWNAGSLSRAVEKDGQKRLVMGAS